MTSPSVRQVLAAIAALLAGVTISVAASGGFDENGKPKGAVSVTVQQRHAAIADRGARDETPAGVPAAAIEAGREQQDRLAYSDQLPIVTPLAASTVPGCVTRTVANRSSRRGVAPRLLVPHYTVSRNTAGWGDVNAIVGLFDRPAFAASSTFVIDAEGNCAYIVPMTEKPWTQAGFNSVSVSIEFIAMGDEGTLSAAAVDKGGRVFAEAARLFHIPLQIGAISGCSVVQGGILDHKALGACGGGHHDLAPLYGASASTAQRNAALLAATKKWTAGVTSVDKVTCRKLNWWRAHGRPKGAAEANAVRRRRALDARGVTCTPSGPVKA